MGVGASLSQVAVFAVVALGAGVQRQRRRPCGMRVGSIGYVSGL